jgi:hypothetical protein
MQQDDVPVYVTVTAATRGGLLVQYNHLEGFIPASHLGQVGARSLIMIINPCKPYLAASAPRLTHWGGGK